METGCQQRMMATWPAVVGHLLLVWRHAVESGATRVGLGGVSTGLLA